MKTNISARVDATDEKIKFGTRRSKRGPKSIVEAIDCRHEQIADHADSLAKATRVAAGVAAVGAAVAAPTGLTAVGVAVGLLSAPLIVTIAPILAKAATIGVAVSAGASLYSKIRRKRSADRTQ